MAWDDTQTDSDSITHTEWNAMVGDVLTEYMVCIWGEENDTLTSGQYQWSFGNGGTLGGAQGGIQVYVPTGYECHCVAMGLNINDSSADATVELVIDGVDQGTDCDVTCTAQYRNLQHDFTPVSISDGDHITFKTTSATDTAEPCYVVAWIRFRKT